MNLKKLKYIKTAQDLVTPINTTQFGFFQQALRKTKEANPYIEAAKQFLDKLQLANDVRELINMKEIRDDLITAAGFSDKSTNYFTPSKLEDALLSVLKEIRDKAIDDWRTEIVYRFLLTRGDTLGGVMRNILGAEATAKFAGSILSKLNKKGIKSKEYHSKKEGQKLQQISWPGRILLFDKKPKLIGKNVDAILLRQEDNKIPISTLTNQRKNYLICGEIKGGIDPAGADEHWKTASGSLNRIRERFPSKGPKLFFVGAAIEDSMANEIFSQLNSGFLEYAANLNSSAQLADLANWLVSF